MPSRTLKRHDELAWKKTRRNNRPGPENCLLWRINSSSMVKKECLHFQLRKPGDINPPDHREFLVTSKYIYVLKMKYRLDLHCIILTQIERASQHPKAPDRLIQTDCHIYKHFLLKQFE